MAEDAENPEGKRSSAGATEPKSPLPKATSSPPGGASAAPSMRPAAGRDSPLNIPAAFAVHDAEDPLIGRVINERVKIIRAIARGGMGKVYFGEQITLGRPCAIKVLDIRVAASEGEDFKKRFLLEASVTAKLTHPNAVTIFDYGETEDGFCYIAMEYLEGKTLAAELKALGRLDPDRAVSIGRQVCRALREAHTLGVVHRDMKPGNIFLVKNDDEGDFAKVLDFGLVKETHVSEGEGAHTQLGQIMGSPRYMAPEQIQGKEIDGRTDIYSLGAVLYVMLTGKVPFDKANEMATMMAHVSEAVPPMGLVVPDLVLPRGLEAVVMRCLAKDPAERFASMEELLAALKVPAGPGVPASTTSGAYFAATTTSGMHSAVNVAAVAPPPPPKTNPAIFLAAVVLVGVVVIGALFVVRRSTAGSAGGASASTSVATTPPAPTPSVTVTAKPVVTATLHVVTEPPGARIKEDDLTVCEETPCDIRYKGADADPKVEHLLMFVKPNYRVEKKIVRVTGETVTLKMTKD